MDTTTEFPQTLTPELRDDCRRAANRDDVVLLATWRDYVQVVQADDFNVDDHGQILAVIYPDDYVQPDGGRW